MTLARLVENDIRTTPLYHFLASANELNLSPTVRIRQITNTEKYMTGDVPNRPEQRGYGWGFEHGYPNSFFVVDWLRTSPDQNDETVRVSASLLMFKADVIGMELPWFIQAEFRSWQATSRSVLPDIDPTDLEPLSAANTGTRFPYVLNSGEEAQFTDFWRTTTSSRWEANLIAASRRLIRAQRRMGFESDEDKIIDLVISFEALVLNKNERGKQRNLASRFSNLVGGSQQQQIESDLLLAYDLRNDAVHDGLLDPTHLAQLPNHPLALTVFLANVENYLRKGMRNYVTFINSGESKNQIIRHL
jgi:hypothetical protein